MKQLIYFALLLLPIHAASTVPEKSAPGKVERLFGRIQAHMATCPKEGASVVLYQSPSSLWPTLLNNFIPALQNLGAWIWDKLGVSDGFWFTLIASHGIALTVCDDKELIEVREEVNAWMLLSRHLAFNPEGETATFRCVNSTLSSLTDSDLTFVSELRHDGNHDLFDEINAHVKDRGKARLLDGIKRATKNVIEMNRMLVSLRRWLGRPGSDMPKVSTFWVAFLPFFHDVPLDQFRKKVTTAPNLKTNQELTDVLQAISKLELHDLGTEAAVRDSLKSYPQRIQLVKVLFSLGKETKKNSPHRRFLEYVLKHVKTKEEWDKVRHYSEWVMRKIGELPEEIFEEHSLLSSREQLKLNELLVKAGLPLLPVESSHGLSRNK